MVTRRVPDNPGSARESWSKPTVRIDWLAGPIAERDGEGREAVTVWLDQAAHCSPDAGFSRAGYNTWFGDRHGTKIAHACDRGTRVIREGPGWRREEWSRFQRTYLVLKGTGLTRMRAQGLDDAGVIQRFRAWRGECNRIDLAVDVCHPKVTPAALFRLYEQNRVVTRFGQRWFGGDEEKGETFYLRGKGQTFRCYDKSAERSRRGVHMQKGVTRFELELRGAWAARAFAQLLRIEPTAWDVEFPKLAWGVILSKMRPLDCERPKHHPDRAPIWKPLREALRDLGPVRLAKEEELRSAEQQLAGRLQHFDNDRKSLAFMLAVLGQKGFDAKVQQVSVDPDDQALLALLLENPERLRSFLVESGFLPREDSPSASPPTHCDASHN